MQDALRRYVRAVNDCDMSAGRAAITRDFSANAPNLGDALNERIRLRPDSCGAPKRNFELASLVRTLRVVTPDAAIGDGYFRTIQLPGGDKAGRAYTTFVKRDERWLLMSIRFHPLVYEPPIVPIEPARTHDQPGPDGWIKLFDGKLTNALTDIGGEPFPSKLWRVEDGLLRCVAAKEGRGLRTRDTYRNFELRWEWKAAPKSNSGIKYHLFFLYSDSGSDGVGREYQMADNAGDPGAIRYAVERAGALYNQLAPVNATPKPIGQFNESALIVHGRRCEHWLNGVKVLEYESESAPLEGPIVLQHHESDMWFRNVRIRRLD